MWLAGEKGGVLLSLAVQHAIMDGRSMQQVCEAGLSRQACVHSTACPSSTACLCKSSEARNAVGDADATAGL